VPLDLGLRPGLAGDAFHAAVDDVVGDPEHVRSEFGDCPLRTMRHNEFVGVLRSPAQQRYYARPQLDMEWNQLRSVRPDLLGCADQVVLRKFLAWRFATRKRALTSLSEYAELLLFQHPAILR
jgi:hypothetical protein